MWQVPSLETQNRPQLDRLDGALPKAFTIDLTPGPDTGQVGNLGLVQEVLRQRMTYLKSHAALEEYKRGHAGQQEKAAGAQGVIL